MKLWQGCAATLAAVLFARGVLGSPYEVDSTDIADRVDLKTGLYYRDGTASDLFVAPAVELEVPMSPDLDLEIGGDYRRHLEANGGRAIETRSTVEMKWRFVALDDHHASWAVLPQLTVPVHRSRLDADRSSMELEVPLVMQKRVGAVTLDARVGYGRTLRSGGEEFVPLGLLVRFHVNRALEVGAEVAGEAPCDRLEDPWLTVDAGFKWTVTDRLEVQGLLGRTVSSSANDREIARLKLVAEVAL
jgi:hypothetical protein